MNAKNNGYGLAVSALSCKELITHHSCLFNKKKAEQNKNG